MDLPGSSARLDEPGGKEVRAAGCRIWDRAGWPLLLPTVGCDDCLGRHSQGLPAATEELGRLELSGPGVVVVLGLSLVWFPGIWCWQRGGSPPKPLVLLVLSSSLELLSPALVHGLGTRGRALSEAGSVFCCTWGF